MLLVLNISNEKGHAYVWDSDTLLVKTWDLKDVIYHHENIEQLNLLIYSNEDYGCFTPVFNEQVISNEAFVLFIGKEMWAIHYNNQYTTKDVSAYTEIIVPVLDRQTNKVNWVSSVRYGTNIILNKLLTIRKDCTRRDFKQKLLGLNGELEMFDNTIF